MAERGEHRKDEKTRLCPSCRCEISVLATKCRHCGEIVGRPKDETRSLSVDDLGGETVCHYAPSSNVMDAIEAFRLEETSAPTAESAPRVRGKGKTSQPQPPANSELPQLDERSRALASLSVPTRRAGAIPVAPKASWQSRAKVVGYFVAAGVVLFVAIEFGKPWIKNIFAKDTTVYVDYNPAQRLLEAKDNKGALLAAVKAQNKAGVSEDAQVLVAARKGVADEVRALLNADPWHVDNLRKASETVEMVVAADPSPENRRLKEDVEKENFAYKMLLASTDPVVGTAKFKLNDPNNPGKEQTGKVGENIGARFVIRGIEEEYVVVEDLVRKTQDGRNRLVRYGLGGLNRMPIQETALKYR